MRTRTLFWRTLDVCGGDPSLASGDRRIGVIGIVAKGFGLAVVSLPKRLASVPEATVLPLWAE